MNGLYIVLTTLVFGFILFNIINNKKVSIISGLLFMVLVIFYAIKRYDFVYFHKMVVGIKYIDIYACVFALLCLVGSILEYSYGCKVYKNSPDRKIKEIQKKEAIDLDRIETTSEPNTKDPEGIDDLLVFLEIMNEPLACLVGETYYLNNKMKKLLDLNSYRLPKKDIISFINYEDKKTYKTDNKVNYFRLNKGNEDSWYEEISASLKGSVYRLIRLSRNNQIDQVEVKPFKEINELLNIYKNQNSNYYLILFDIKNSSDFTEVYGSDFRKIVINKYLKNIKNLPYLKSVNLYNISITEYALILEHSVEYQTLLIELDNGNSLFLHQDIYVNETKITVQSKVAVVDSSLIKTGSINDVLKAGYATLSLACSKDYNGDYAIYSPVDDKVDYTIKDIDLDIDIDKYNKMMK